MQLVTVFTTLMTVVSGVWAGSQDLADDFDNEDFHPFVGSGHDKFDWELCAALDEREPGNVVASPLSVKLLLTLLYEVSTGHTAKQLEDMLQLTNNRAVTRALFTAIVQTLQAPNKDYDLALGFRIYTSNEVYSRTWLRNVLAKNYNSYIQSLNFNVPELALKKINLWVRDTTHGRIKELVSDESSLRGTSLMLISTIYFQGQWKHEFPVEYSYNGAFFTPKGTQPVRYMTQTGLFYLSESSEIDAQLLRLPYEGNKFSMYILLPRKANGLNNLLSKIHPFILRSLIRDMEETSVALTLPNFKFEFTMNLNNILKGMGLGSIFERFQDVRGIGSDKNLAVSSVVQKACIEVDEKGTIAAAATAVKIVNKSAIPDIIFNATHPFVFFIRDEATGTVIFEGKLVYPETKEAQLDIKPTSTVQPETTPKPNEKVEEMDRFVNRITSGTKPRLLAPQPQPRPSRATVPMKSRKVQLK